MRGMVILRPMKNTLTAIAFAALASTAYAAIEMTDKVEQRCLPTALQQALA